MPVQIDSHRLRIAFDIAKYSQPVVEKRSGETPQIWRGNDLRIEVVVMDDGAVLDVGNLASLTFEVRLIDDIDGTPQMQKTVSSGALDNTVTDTTWTDDTKEHAVFEFTDAETNLASPGDDYPSTWEREYYIVLSGVTTGGNIITYQTGKLIFREDGSGSAGTPPTNDPNYYTIPQTDAAFVAKAGSTMTGPLVLSADPVEALGAATKQYVDAAGSNVGWKRPVRVASTANVTISGPGAAIDGVTLSNGDRVLLKDQTTASENGLYVFNGAASAMTRAADANTDALMEPGLRVAVNEGTANADRAFMLTTNAPITLGTTALTFTQVSALGQVTLPAGLTKTSNEVAAWHASTHATPAGVNLTTDGAAATPALARSTDLNTGLFFPGADRIGISTGGTQRLEVGATGNIGLHTAAPAFPLDLTGEARVTSRVTAQGFETDAGAISVLDTASATIASNNLPFPDGAQVLLVGAGTVNTVSNVRAGALYLIVATGAVTLTDSATINCLHGGNVVLAADEAVQVIGLSPTKIAVIGGTLRHRVASGSAAAPSIFFDAETTTGIFRSAAGVFGFAISGVERLKLGASGNDILAQFPDYNFIINPSSTTAGRGNLGLWNPSGYGSGAGVIGLPMLSDRVGVTPTVSETDNLLMWADYIGASPALWLKSAAVSHVIGGSNVNFFASDATFTFGVAAATAGFYNNGAQVTTIGAHSDTTSLFPTLRRRKSRNTLASPNSLQSLDTIARDEALGFGGAAYQTAFRQDVIAAEAFGASAAGADVVWSTCPAGSATLTERMRLTSAGNWLFGGAAAPASLVNGHVLANGTAPSADPTNAAVIVPVSGELQYRTSAASEGAGQMNRLHNRGAETEGSGTDTLSGSYTDVDFGAGALTLTLPAGTAFQVFAMIEFTSGSGVDESVGASAQLVRGTSTVVINPHTVTLARDASFDRKQTLTLMGVVTGIGNAVLKLQALSADGVTVSRARIGYVRLY